MAQHKPAQNTNHLEFFATCLPGTEALLAQELKDLSIAKVRPLKGGVTFFASAHAVLRVCLWSRLSGRILLTLGRVDATDADALYREVYNLPWESILSADAVLGVRGRGTNEALRNSHFMELKAKDAICDRLREKTGKRPSVDAKQATAVIEIRLKEHKATVSLDLTGASLHQRSYLNDGDGQNASSTCALAASVLALAQWNEKAQQGWGFIDPACDDGIMACEAASILSHQAPSLYRSQWGFYAWTEFDSEYWEDLLAQADERFEVGLAALGVAAMTAEAPCKEQVRVVGLSESSPSIARARTHAKAAGLRSVLSIEAANENQSEVLSRLATRTRQEQSDAAILVGHSVPLERDSQDARALAEVSACIEAYQQSPEGSEFAWSATEAIDDRFSESALSKITTVRGQTKIVLEVLGGPLQSLHSLVVPDPFGGKDHEVLVHDQAAQQFASRLAKVARERRRWAKREGISAYRIYDADLPDYACAIDLYQGTGETEGRTFIHLAEYQAPSSVDPALARRRFEDMLALTPVVLGVRPDEVFSKLRTRSKGGSQYSDYGHRNYVIQSQEGGLTFELDLAGYLDTGLFLDHRITRSLVGAQAKAKRFLNLFAYTGSATVYAAAGGATETTTVDLSQTYLDWAARNMAANGFTCGSGTPHQLVKADVMAWITQARRERKTFDLIFVDPPTFSNSKAMGKRTWDVQRDHVELLVGVSRLLAPQGEAIFSCNLRNFKPDWDELERLGVEMEDITASTIAHDFERNPKIHHCYRVRRKK